MAAHVSETPDPLTKHRSAASEGLNALVMRCLEKKAADRWQNAADLILQLEAMTTPSGGITPTGTQPVPAVSTETAAHQAHPVRVAGLFGLASVGALTIVYFLLQLFGLPDWVFYGAIVLLGIGFPIILLTGHHERRRAIARTTGMLTATPAGGVQRHFTWRKSLLGGGIAFAGLGVFASGYMAMRAMGIGPAGTLITTGVLEERDRLILADFANFTEDTTLGRSVTEAFRIDLAQSLVVTLMDASDIAEVLERMDRVASTRLDQQLAREVAQREGVKAFLAGEISTLGEGYVMSATLVSSTEGDVLEALRETANDRSEIIAAVDRLSAKLRARIGESLKTIRANEPLDRVTTSSLDALEKYSRSVDAEQAGDFARAIALLEEAIALDSAFAMAHRKLGLVLGFAGRDLSRQIEAYTTAFRHRDRLPEMERYLAEAHYYAFVEADLIRSGRAYRSILELDPNHTTALNNLATVRGFQQQWQEAEALALRGMDVGKLWQLYENALWSQVPQGKLDAAHVTLARFGEAFPDHPRVLQYTAFVNMVEGHYDSAQAQLLALGEQTKGSPTWQRIINDTRSSLDELQGKIASAEEYIKASMRAAEQSNQAAPYINSVIELAWKDLSYRDDPTGGVRKIEVALERLPLADMPVADRPYLALAEFFAHANEPARARRFLDEFQELSNERLQRAEVLGPGIPQGTAAVALAEGRTEEAIAWYRRRSQTGCTPCGLFDLARAYDVAGQRDSTLAVFERRVNNLGLYQIFNDASELAPTYRRLGELYEERGNRERAIEHYNNFVELWSDADPELRQAVEDVKGRIARLIGER
jgi:tetratricopeptide (TPR) repeat protein